jgi:hypothetical protein
MNATLSSTALPSGLKIGDTVTAKKIPVYALGYARNRKENSLGIIKTSLPFEISGIFGKTSHKSIILAIALRGKDGFRFNAEDFAFTPPQPAEYMLTEW